MRERQGRGESKHPHGEAMVTCLSSIIITGFGRMPFLVVCIVYISTIFTMIQGC